MGDFELDTYLSQNLRIKKFEVGRRNDFLVYDAKTGEWYIDYKFRQQSQFVYFEKIDDSVAETLTEKGITMRELQENYRYLGWL